jgi:predicted methyltransferase
MLNLNASRKRIGTIHTNACSYLLRSVHNKLFGPADMTAVSAAIYRALKPGGVYIVVDHVAKAGSGLRDTETLHRIDPAQVKAEALAAGFLLERESQSCATRRTITASGFSTARSAA